MDSFVSLLDTQLVLLVGAIAVFFLSLRLLFQVLQAGLGSMAAILAIVLVLYYVFGISPEALWFEISHLPQDLAQWAQSLA
ncbi:hypothetical protein ACQ4M4_24405 [Leptolyngbya sp. AN02str]|uniref:hypothetical protein n=1 Tax=Leptolyngbya sp. AN02str TaxID=3423363 RepID=UPI003D31B972